MPTIRVNPTPLAESDGSFGHHVDTPRARAESFGTFGHHVEDGDTPTSSTVNGVTHVLPPRPTHPK
jgi:hypothetical protein